jgi:hypothetical protein
MERTKIGGYAFGVAFLIAALIFLLVAAYSPQHNPVFQLSFGAGAIVFGAVGVMALIKPDVVNKRVHNFS